MTSKNTAIVVIIGAILVAIIYGQYKKVQELKLQIINDRKISKQVREQLLQLLQSDINLDPEIKAELLSIAELLKIEQETKAVFSLAKIIENLLRKYYETNEIFLAKKNTTTFTNLLEFAKEDKLISLEEFHLLNLLRVIRNQEGHEVNVKKEKSKILVKMTTGISFIIKISKLLNH